MDSTAAPQPIHLKMIPKRLPLDSPVVKMVFSEKIRRKQKR
jgi:hypothetical protein